MRLAARETGTYRYVNAANEKLADRDYYARESMLPDDVK